MEEYSGAAAQQPSSPSAQPFSHYDRVLRKMVGTRGGAIAESFVGLYSDIHCGGGKQDRIKCRPVHDHDRPCFTVGSCYPWFCRRCIGLLALLCHTLTLTSEMAKVRSTEHCQYPFFTSYPCSLCFVYFLAELLAGGPYS